MELSPGLRLSWQLSNLQNPSAQTPTPPPFRLINFLFASVMQGSFEIHTDCIFLLFLHSIALKKKINISICSHYKIKVIFLFLFFQNTLINFHLNIIDFHFFRFRKKYWNERRRKYKRNKRKVHEKRENKKIKQFLVKRYILIFMVRGWKYITWLKFQ